VIALLMVLAGIALLYGGAEALVRGSSRLAVRSGMSPLVVGLTVVAFGTSAPELVVSVQAALAGAGGIAVGNVVGSNIANVGLILGLSVLVRPLLVDRRVMRADLPAAAAATVIVAAMLLDREVGRVEGALLAAGLVAYLALSLRDARRHPQLPAGEAPPEAPAGSFARDAGLAAVGLVLVVAGAEMLVRGGTEIAAAMGVPPTVIGLSLVAVGTSLPELAASLVAAARGHGDLALGNVVGSNLFNALGILGVASLTAPLAAPDLALGDLAAMLAAIALLFPLAVSGGRLGRAEGAALLVLYAGYMVWVLGR
jgi:cation:H+ antiporter